MHAKRIVMVLGCVTLLGSANVLYAQPRSRDVHAQGLSHSERMRMRGDLERFSREQPYRDKIEMRRQMLRERARQRFQHADRDGNGFLNRQELRHLNPNAARHFDQIDRDHDGELSEQEVGQAMRRRMRRQSAHDLPSEGDEPSHSQ